MGHGSSWVIGNPQVTQVSNTQMLLFEVQYRLSKIILIILIHYPVPQCTILTPQKLNQGQAYHHILRLTPLLAHDSYDYRRQLLLSRCR